MKKWFAGLSVLFALNVSVLCARGATLTWSGTDGIFTDPTNWAGGVAPTAVDQVNFAKVGIFNVQFTNSTTNLSFMGNNGVGGSVNLDLGGKVWAVLGQFWMGGPVAGALWSGAATVSNGTLVLTNAAANAQDALSVGRQFQGFLTLDNASLIMTNAGLVVGRSYATTSGSRMTVQNGAQVYLLGNSVLNIGGGSSYLPLDCRMDVVGPASAVHILSSGATAANHFVGCRAGGAVLSIDDRALFECTRNLMLGSASTASNAEIAVTGGGRLVVTNAAGNATLMLREAGAVVFFQNATGIVDRLVVSNNGQVVMSTSSLIVSGTGTVALANSLVLGGDSTLAAAKMATANYIQDQYGSVPTLTVAGGTFNVLSNSPASAVGVQVAAPARLQGQGRFSGRVTVDGTLAPGVVAAGEVVLDGGLTLNSTAQLAIEIGGTNRSTEYDYVNAGALSVTLGGALNISLVNGFRPAPEDSFTILSGWIEGGAFTNVSGGKVAVGDSIMTVTVTPGAAGRVVLSNFSAPGPTVTVTNPASAVTGEYATTSYTVQGTKNSSVVGLMGWTNALAGATGSFPASDTWSLVVNLGIGTNRVVFTGTNAAGAAGTATATIIRKAYSPSAPFVAITNPAAPVALNNDVTSYALQGTNNLDVLYVGRMSWSNALTGARQVFAVTGYTWQATVTGLAVGTNTITVLATNVLGQQHSAAAQLIRAATGYGVPLVTITTTSHRIDSPIGQLTIGGVINSDVVGTMAWTNSGTGEAGTFPATPVWQIPDMPMAQGVNSIHVTGTNLTALVSDAEVIILRGDNVIHFGLMRGALPVWPWRADDYLVSSNWVEQQLPDTMAVADFHTNVLGSRNFSVNWDTANVDGFGNPNPVYVPYTAVVRKVQFDALQGGSVGCYPWASWWLVTERLTIGSRPDLAGGAAMWINNSQIVGAPATAVIVTNAAGTAEVIIGEASPGVLGIGSANASLLVDRLIVTNGSMDMWSAAADHPVLTVKRGMLFAASPAASSFSTKGWTVLGGESFIENLRITGVMGLNYLQLMPGSLTVRELYSENLAGRFLVGEGSNTVSVFLAGDATHLYSFRSDLILNSPGGQVVLSNGTFYLNMVSATYPEAVLRIEQGAFRMLGGTSYVQNLVMTNTGKGAWELVGGEQRLRTAIVSNGAAVVVGAGCRLGFDANGLQTFANGLHVRGGLGGSGKGVMALEFSHDLILYGGAHVAIGMRGAMTEGFWDILKARTLAVSNSVGQPVTIELSGEGAGFNNALNHSWLIMTGAVPIVVSDPAAFQVVTGGFVPDLGGGTFSVRVDGVSMYLDFNSNVAPPAAPAWLAASDASYTDRIQARWEKVAGAQGYEVWRGLVNNSATAALMGVADGTNEYADLTPTVDTIYYYWVKATNAIGASGFSPYDQGMMLTALDQDSDKDGVSDASEVSARTDPFDNTSYLRVLSAGLRDGYVLQWGSALGKTYTVQKATNVMTGFKSNIVVRVPATPPVNTHTSTVGGAAGFFRVQADPNAR